MDGIRRKLLDISTIGVADITARVVATVFWLYVASVLGPANYGEIAYLLSIAAIVSGLAIFGSSHTLLVTSAKKIDIHSTIYAISMTSGVASSIVISLFLLNAGVGFVIFGYAAFALITSDLLGKKLYKKYSKYVLLQKLLLVVLGIGLYQIMGDVGLLVGIGLSHMPVIMEIIRELRRSRINLALFREKRSFIANNFALSISILVHDSLDKLLIVPLMGFEVVGNYSLGLQFFMIMLLLPSTVMKYLIPHDAGGTSNKRIKTLSVLASIAFAVLGSIFGPMVATSLFPEFEATAGIISIMSWAVIPFTINQVFFFSKFWANEMSKKIVISSVAAVTIQAACIILMGPVYGTTGIALALLVSMICGLICSMLLDRRA